MFYHFILPLQQYLSFLRLFQYITFRSIYAAVTALLFVLIFGKYIINYLHVLKFGEQIRALGPESHKAKAGTPTMGGVIILAGVIFSILLWGNFSNYYLIILIVAMILLGAIGFVDDYIKAVKKNKNGLSAKQKLIFQFITAIGVSVILYCYPSSEESVSKLYIPFINKAVFDFSWFWIVFASVVIVGFSNAVNLTDGLDGLATGCVLIATVALATMTYVTGHIQIADYLRVPYINASAELTVFLAALGGALIGFLWFNSSPASVFMGDTGALALGGIIGIVGVMIKKEIFLVMVGGIFVIEALSVIIQVLYYKLTKKRFFKMAPIHHHFELSGLSEQKVVVRMWIIGIILMVLGLSTLKIL